jgi:ribosomal protein S12 methylthiotransferase
VGAFTYSPEQGTSGWDLPDRVPANIAQSRYQAVIAARDEVLKSSQGAWIGKDLEILVDEQHPGVSTVVGRGVMDAPEVDLVAMVRGSKASVGDIIRVRVESLDAESNLVCKPAGKR